MVKKQENITKEAQESIQLLKELKILLLELKSENQKEWWPLKDCCKRKGICYKTVCNRPNLQPSHGEPDGYVGGRKVWRYQTVMSWISKTDKEMTDDKLTS